MRYILLVTIAAMYALAQPTTVGVLMGGGVLVPSGTYDEGKWAAPNPTSIPKEWTLWGNQFHGIAIRTKAECTQCDAGTWLTNLPKQGKKKTDIKTTLGVVTSQAVPVIVMQDRTTNRSDQEKVAAFLGQTIKLHLNSFVAKKQLHPSRIVAKPLKIKRSETTVDGQTYYHVVHTSELYGPQVCPGKDWPHQDFDLDMWFTESEAGIRNLTSLHSQSEDCVGHGAGSAWLDPIGIVVLDGVAFVVARESYYEGESAVILSLSPHAVRQVLRNHWTQD